VWLLFVILEVGGKVFVFKENVAYVLGRGREKRAVFSVTRLAKNLTYVMENSL